MGASCSKQRVGHGVAKIQAKSRPSSLHHVQLKATQNCKKFIFQLHKNGESTQPFRENSESVQPNQ